jgi:hypothetical protein
VFATEGDGPEKEGGDPDEAASADVDGDGSVGCEGAGRRFCSLAASDSMGVDGIGVELDELEDEAKGEER